MGVWSEKNDFCVIEYVNGSYLTSRHRTNQFYVAYRRAPFDGEAKNMTTSYCESRLEVDTKWDTECLCLSVHGHTHMYMCRWMDNPKTLCLQSHQQDGQRHKNTAILLPVTLPNDDKVSKFFQFMCKKSSLKIHLLLNMSPRYTIL